MSNILTSEKVIEMMSQLRDIHGAINDFNLSGYAQRQTANNCMDAINEIAATLLEYQKEQNENELEE